VKKWRSGEIKEIGSEIAPSEPARPANVKLVPPREMPKRTGLNSQVLCVQLFLFSFFFFFLNFFLCIKAGRVALMHSLVHIGKQISSFSFSYILLNFLHRINCVGFGVGHYQYLVFFFSFFPLCSFDFNI
jgi:hypothetical protein